MPVHIRGQMLQKAVTTDTLVSIVEAMLNVLDEDAPAGESMVRALRVRVRGTD